MKNNKGIHQTFTKDDINLSMATLEEFKVFREYHPAGRLSKNLRNILIDFLMFEGATEAKYLPDLLYDLEGLFELLDEIEADDTESILVQPRKSDGFR